MPRDVEAKNSSAETFKVPANRKRVLKAKTSSLPASESETETEPMRKINSSRRGRAVPATHRVGLAKARQALKEKNDNALEEHFNKSLRRHSFSQPSSVAADDDSESSLSACTIPEDSCDVMALDDDTMNMGSMDPEESREKARRLAKDILEVATKSGHLKGTFVKRLKDDAKGLLEIVETFVGRPESETTKRLRAENARLRRFVATLEAENRSHKRQFSEVTAAAKAPESSNEDLEGLVGRLEASLTRSFGKMLDARMAGIEGRLLPEQPLRPPLATDKRKAAKKTHT